MNGRTKRRKLHALKLLEKRNTAGNSLGEWEK